MTSDTRTIDIDGTPVGVGTSVYDAKYDRVFWIADIEGQTVSIDVAAEYDDDQPLWESGDGAPTRVADGSGMPVETFGFLVEIGRFEIGPQPTDSDFSA